MKNRSFSIKSRAFCASGFLGWPFWFLALQVGWRHWQWWEVIFSDKGTKLTHLDMMGLQ